MSVIRVCAVLLAVGAWAAGAEVTGNLLDNGSFEEGQKGWTLNPAFQEAVIEAIAGEEGKDVHGGKQALRLVNKGGWSNIYQSGGLVERDYELTFYARGGEIVTGEDGKPVAPHVSVNVYIDGNTDKTARSIFLVTHQKLRPKQLGGEWLQFKLGIKISASQTSGARNFNIAMGTQGDVFLDDVVLQEVMTWKKGLIFYLPFEEGVEAAMAGGKAAPEMQGKVALVEGRKGRAASFVDKANLVFDAEGNFDQAEGTLAMWVKPYWSDKDGMPHSFLEVPVLPETFMDGGFVVTKGFTAAVNPDLFYFYNSPGHYNIYTSFGFEANEWVHVACSWSAAGKRLKLYRNGDLLRVTQFDQLGRRPSSSGRQLVVGARLGGTTPENAAKDPNWDGHIVRGLPTGGGYGADAAIDELMIFNRPLDDVEVALLAESEVETVAQHEPLDASHISRLEQRLKTPHISFGRPSALEPVRALFVVPVGAYSNVTGRDVVELAQRCDIDFTAVTVFGPKRLGWSRAFFRQWQGLSSGDKAKELMERLAEKPEVIVLANIDLSCLPRQVKGSIDNLVRQGAGLIATFPHNPDDPIFKEDVSEGPDAILAGIPVGGLDECFPGSDLSVKELGHKVVKTYRYGQGRVATVTWDEKKPSYEVLAPLATGGRWTRQYEHRYNYYLAVVGKAVQWVAAREPRALWDRLPTEGQTLSVDKLPRAGLPVAIAWAGKEEQSATLDVTFRDPEGRVEQKTPQEIALRGGVNSLFIPIPDLKAGQHYLDLVLTSGGKVENRAAVSFFIERPEQITELTTNRKYCRKGDVLQGTVRFRGALTAPAELRVLAVDTWGRIYSRAVVKVPAGAEDAAFQIAVDRPTTLASYIEVDLTRSDQVLSDAETIIFVTKRDDYDFLSMMWTGFRGTDGVPGQIALRQLRRAGFNAVYHWDYGGDFHNDAMADMMPVQYCSRMTFRPGKGGWLSAQSFPANSSINDRSLGNPQVQKALRDLAAEVYSESGRLGPPWYSLGDENWFQAGFGYSPYGLGYFRDFLKRRYGSIEKLNQEYGSDHADFKDVPRYRSEQGSLPAQIDHLLATDDEWAAFHQFLADEIRKHDPEGRVGAEGSEAGDMERMLDGVQVWAPYGQLRYKLLLRSLASPEVLRSHWWGSYRNQVLEYEKDKGLYRFWGFLFRGFANFLEYFAAFGVEGMFEPDLSFRAHFRDKVLPELREIWSGPAQLLSGSEVVSDDSIAMHYSRVSHHASQMLTDLATTAASESALLTALDGLGQDFRYVSPRQIAAGKLHSPQAQLLFLPSSHALSEEEAKGIAAFVKEGGTVIADFMPGIVNEYGRRLPAGRLDEVFGATCGGKTSAKGLSQFAIQTELSAGSISLSTSYTRADAALVVKGAAPLARTGDIPLLLINQYGRGRSILLNFDLSRFSRPLQFDLVAKLIAAAGVEPHYRLRGSKGAILSVLERGEVTLLGVILPQGSEERAMISWETALHAYDVRAGRHLGKVSEIALPSVTEGGRIHLFALQSEPVTALNVSAAEQIERGETLPLEIRLEAGRVSPKERLIRIDTTDPGGSPVPHYQDFVVLQDESGRSEIPFAFNDTVGKWTVRATDIVSGVSGEQTVIVY